MENDKETWGSWLNSIPVPQQTALYEVLRNRFNGKHATTPEPEASSTGIITTRTPTEDLLLDNSPLYVDVFNLLEMYKRLAFETNLILKGPKGGGKTLSIFAFANLITCPVVIQECSEETKYQHLMGAQSFLGDKTFYTLGSIPTAIDVANECGQCILLFEEINALTPQIQKLLNPISDFRKMVSMPSIGKRYRLRDDARLWLTGTMNPTAYGGTYDMNEDLKSRFEEVELTYPEFGQEKHIVKEVCGSLGLSDDLIDQTIRFARETRQQATGYALSTRDVNRFLNVVSRVGLQNALQMIVGKFEDTDKDLILKRIPAVFLGIKPVKKFWGTA